MDGGERRGGLRTFLLGGLVGASAAAAALNRRRRAQRRRSRPRGLRASFRELAVPLRAARARARREPADRSAALIFPAHRADLRIPLPERARVRDVPADVRSARRNVCDVRCRSGREAPLPGRRALQGVGLLLDRLRLAQVESQGQRVVVGREVVGQAAEKPATDAKPKPASDTT